MTTNILDSLLTRVSDDAIKNTREALLKNPRSLSPDQRTTLAGIQATNGPLYRAYLLKEQLRAVFQGPGPGRGQAPADRLAGVGPALSSPGVRQARQNDQEVSATDPQRR